MSVVWDMGVRAQIYILDLILWISRNFGVTLGFSRNLGISNINEHYINTVVYEPT